MTHYKKARATETPQRIAFIKKVRASLIFGEHLWPFWLDLEKTLPHPETERSKLLAFQGRNDT